MKKFRKQPVVLIRFWFNSQTRFFVVKPSWDEMVLLISLAGQFQPLMHVDSEMQKLVEMISNSTRGCVDPNAEHAMKWRDCRVEEPNGGYGIRIDCGVRM